MCAVGLVLIDCQKPPFLNDRPMYLSALARPARAPQKLLFILNFCFTIVFPASEIVNISIFIMTATFSNLEKSQEFFDILK